MRVILPYLVRLSVVEASAMRGLREKICANKTDLQAEFQRRDADSTGEQQLQYACSVALTQYSRLLTHVCVQLTALY